MVGEGGEGGALGRPEIPAEIPLACYRETQTPDHAALMHVAEC